MQEAKAPFTIEIVRSIARLCGEDPYKLWHHITSKAEVSLLASPSPTTTKNSKVENASINPKSGEPRWRCSACDKEFNDVKHLVNHITFFVRQRDRSHIELYRKIKEYSDKSGKSFTQAAEEMLKLGSTSIGMAKA